MKNELPSDPSSSSRRDFLKQAGALTAAAMVGEIPATGAAQQQPASAPSTGPLPWYRTTYRWGQTNITEADVAQYDIAWWRQHWKRTAVQGVIINAGGIYAYYPSNVPLHHRAATLGDRDLYGELAAAAHEDGLAVFARMDSRGGHEPLYRAHPDWFAIDANGTPYRSGEMYQACINSPYYEQYIPQILREIIQRSHPQGITDNSWSGLGRNSICFCDNCVRRFREHSGGKDLPRRRDWDDTTYRQWIEWNYARRIELWDANNRVTREAGGPDCLWVGMNGGTIGGQSESFRDYKRICERTPILMLDYQQRGDTGSFHENAYAGKLIHGLIGWDKLIPESMAMYQMARSVFRLSSKPAPEARMWMLAGFAGGIQPWWHHVGAYHEDRRMYRTAEPVLQWHKANEQYLIDRRPIASVAVVWSQRNQDYFGRDNAEDLVEQPRRGFVQALVRARIPYLPVHIDDIEKLDENVRVLILPNLGSMSDAQVASVRRFVERGGSLVATGQTSLFNEWGDPRSDYALSDLFGVTGGKPAPPATSSATQPAAASANRDRARHTYLRLTPELRGLVYGPMHGDEPAVKLARHPALAGFDETDLLPFGGVLQPLSVKSGTQVLLTFVPEIPVFPPEIVWMRQPKTDIPGLVINENGAGRVAFMPADIDRRYAIDNLPDHADLLANVVRWAARDTIPLEVHGPGLLNCELYEQPGRLILHVVNFTSAGTWRAPVDELISVGPLQVRVRLPKTLQPKTLRMLVNGNAATIGARDGWAHFDLPSVLDHEVIVLEA
jgi:hypothetical protein